MKFNPVNWKVYAALALAAAVTTVIAVFESGLLVVVLGVLITGNCALNAWRSRNDETRDALDVSVNFNAEDPGNEWQDYGKTHRRF